MSSESISSLDKERRHVADQIILGLKTAPATHPDSPCINTLPLMLYIFRMLSTRIGEIGSDHAMFDVRSKYGDLLDAFAIFANSIWTPDEISMFKNCQCERHEYRSERIDMDVWEWGMKECQGGDCGYLQYIIIQIFQTLSSAGLDMGFTKSDALKLEKKPGKRGRWPTSPSKFIPHGASVAVSAFMKWAELADSPAPLYALRHAMPWCPSLVAATTENEEFLPLVQRLFHQFVDRLRRFTLTPVSDLGLSAMRLDIDRFADVVDLECQWIQDLSIKATQRYMATRIVDVRSWRPFAAMHRDLYEIITHLETPDISENVVDAKRWIKSFAVMAMGMWALMPPSFEESILIHQHMIDILQQDREDVCNEEELRSIELIEATSFVRHQRRCVETTCLVTGEESKINLQLCSGCQAVRYCSKACQRSNWKQHKKVCKLLKVLVSTVVAHYYKLPFDTEYNDSVRIFTSALNQVGFTKENATAVLEYMAEVRAVRA